MVESPFIHEEDYHRFVEKAQEEHYFTAIVTMPLTVALEKAAKRSTLHVDTGTMEMMMNQFEPTQLLHRIRPDANSPKQQLHAAKKQPSYHISA